MNAAGLIEQFKARPATERAVDADTCIVARHDIAQRIVVTEA